MQKAIGYIRVSTAGQATEGVSLEAQRAKIEAWAVLNDYELVAIYEDAGISGMKSDRDGLSAALKATKKGYALVAYSMSRLSRSTRDMLELSDTLQKRGADLVSLSEKIDTTSAAGKMIFRLLAVMSEFERDQISERTKSALQHKKQSGMKYSPVPFGYRELNNRLVKVESEYQAVAAMVRMREQGETLQAIADHLNQQGITGKRGGQWAPASVRYVLKRQPA